MLAQMKVAELMVAQRSDFGGGVKFSVRVQKVHLRSTEMVLACGANDVGRSFRGGTGFEKEGRKVGGECTPD